MNKTIQTILLVLSFLACAALGYFLAGRLGQERPEVTVERNNAAVEAEQPAESAAPAPRVLEVDKPEYQQKTGLYVFRARGEGKDIVFYLADANGAVIKDFAQHTTDAVFEVPPVPSGVYNVYVVDADNRHSEMVKVEGCTPKAVAQVKKVTVEELSSLLSAKNTSAARSALDGRIAPGCRVNCPGLSEAEENPTSYVEIISRLKRSWASINITGLDYDAQGRIRSVNLTVTQNQ